MQDTDRPAAPRVSNVGAADPSPRAEASGPPLRRRTGVLITVRRVTVVRGFFCGRRKTKRLTSRRAGRVRGCAASPSPWPPPPRPAPPRSPAAGSPQAAVASSQFARNAAEAERHSAFGFARKRVGTAASPRVGAPPARARKNAPPEKRATTTRRKMADERYDPTRHGDARARWTSAMRFGTLSRDE